MQTQPKPLDDISTSASDILVPSGFSGMASPVCMRSRTNFSIAPSLPPGWKLAKSSAVKPRPSSSAIASASPIAACISDEVVGARLCGQASRAFGSSSTMSAASPSEEAAFEVTAIIGMREAAGIIDEVLHLRLLAGPRQRDDDVVRRDHAEIAMAGLGGVHEEGRRAGGGERRRDLARDMAGLAEPGDDDAALGLRGSGRRRRQRPRPSGPCKRRRDRGDAAGFRHRACAAPTERRRSRDRCRMIVPSAVSNWPCRGSEGGGASVRPGPLLSTADSAMRRAAPVLNGSLTIIVLTPLTTFSARAFARAELVGKRMNLLEYFSS